MVRVVLAEKGVPHERLVVLPGQEEEDWFLNLNPAGTLPVLVDRDLTIRDALVMFEYLEEVYPERPLLPEDPVGRVRVRTMVRAAEDLGHALEDLYLTQELDGDSDPDLLDDLREEVRLQLEYIANDLDGLSWAGGAAFSLADAALAPMLLGLLRELELRDLLAGLPALEAYVGRLSVRPSTAVVGVAWTEWREMLAQLTASS